MIRELLMAAGVATTGCGIAINEDTALYSDSNIRIHELKHQEQMRELCGGSKEFWETYVSDPQQACAWEIEAGIAAGAANPENHPACNGLFE